MGDLSVWLPKLQEARKHTDWKVFLKEIACRKPYNFYKVDGAITRYPNKERKVTIVTNKAYDESVDDDTGIMYDDTKTFFENYNYLFTTRPLGHLINFYTNENSEYSDCNFGVKNSYLSTTVGIDSDTLLYSAFCYGNVSTIVNSLMITNNSEHVFESIMVSKSFKVFYSKYINGSNNIRFSSNLIGCNECLFCDKLENKSYCIQNKEYEKDEYMKRKQQLLAHQEKFVEWSQAVSDEAVNYGCENSTGNAIYYCSNLENGNMMSRLHGGRNVMMGDCIEGGTEFYDSFDVGVNSDHFYGAMSAGDAASHLYMSIEVGQSSHIFYSYQIDTCSYCFGCVGLRNKSYCILNKQYTKEEWHEKVDHILARMEQEGVLGAAFPGRVNPFYFNDTLAYLIDGNHTQKEIEADGFLRREEKIKADIPAGAEVIETSALDQFESRDKDGKRLIDKIILTKVIKDEEGNLYKVVMPEYEFLMQHGLPLPRLHRQDRIHSKFEQH